jgi:hypothetical protein
LGCPRARYCHMKIVLELSTEDPAFRHGLIWLIWCKRKTSLVSDAITDYFRTSTRIVAKSVHWLLSLGSFVPGLPDLLWVSYFLSKISKEEDVISIPRARMLENHTTT